MAGGGSACGSVGARPIVVVALSVVAGSVVAVVGVAVGSTACGTSEAVDSSELPHPRHTSAKHRSVAEVRVGVTLRIENARRQSIHRRLQRLKKAALPSDSLFHTLGGGSMVWTTVLATRHSCFSVGGDRSQRCSERCRAAERSVQREPNGEPTPAHTGGRPRTPHGLNPRFRRRLRTSANVYGPYESPWRAGCRGFESLTAHQIHR